MFDDLFNGFKDFIGSQVQKAVSEVEKLFAIPEPVEPFTLVRQFTLDDSTVSQGGISIFGGNWQIEAYDDGDGIKNFLRTTEPLRNVILFEVPEPGVEESVLACRFYAKALKTQTPIKVHLSLCRQGQLGGTFTKSWSQGVSPTNDMKFYEVRAHFKKEVEAAKIQINIQFESRGILQIRDVELLQAAVKSQA